MEEVVLVIHLILALSIIGLVLLQRSEGGGLGIGSSGGMGAFASAHTTASILSRMTAICAAGFFATSLILGILTGQQSHQAGIMNRLTETPAATAPAQAGKALGDKPSTDASPPAIVPGKNEAAPPPKAEKATGKNTKPLAPVSK
jgi:preprotein translocase subunit SecG